MCLKNKKVFKISNKKVLYIGYPIYRLPNIKIISKLSNKTHIKNKILHILKAISQLKTKKDTFIKEYLKGLIPLFKGVSLGFIKLLVLKGKVYKESN